MTSTVAAVEKSQPHVVCVPYPTQGHINPMLHVAKLLHSRGFHVTFVNTDYNHKRLLKSWGAAASFPSGFDFESIPDGLPQSNNIDSSQSMTSLCVSITNNLLAPFRDLVQKLNDRNNVVSPRVSCIISDAAMGFTLDVARELGIPDALFLCPSACANLPLLSYPVLVERGLVPLKDSSYLTNGYLDTVVDCILGLNKNMRLKDLPTFMRTTNPNDVVFNFCIDQLARIPEGSALIMNTFDSLEQEVLSSISTLCPNLLSVGPLTNLLDQVKEEKVKNINTNLWAEHPESLKWLDSQEDNSVLYVNFGSVAVMTPDQLTEFAWGLAKSEKPFLWIIRPDLVYGNSEGALSVPSGFVEETRGRGLLTSWCNQEQVLKHRSVGGFLSHMGWNSTLESILNGVPIVCWPFFADQQTNCFYACREWGIGMEIGSEVKKGAVEKLVREVMGGEKGKEMKRKAMEWKLKAEEATQPGGSSFRNLDKLIEILLQNTTN
uniref:UDP-glycosyltransferase 1 n=1 Tax=Linum usitatissimum TaxID=4006 RepID=I2BHA9_LINUS|nr:UDP-glycosyltransferase 1 [Linum usitatissimum]